MWSSQPYLSTVKLNPNYFDNQLKVQYVRTLVDWNNDVYVSLQMYLLD